MKTGFPNLFNIPEWSCFAGKGVAGVGGKPGIKYKSVEMKNHPHG
ncbi:MAG: hypothetical protein PHT07_08060 [Paludibacter sp.]|nr:hypothetical protein [Paludibacter sp.]